MGPYLITGLWAHLAVIYRILDLMKCLEKVPTNILPKKMVKNGDESHGTTKQIQVHGGDSE